MPSNPPPERCEWMTLTDALRYFVLGLPSHQSAKHIKRMHWYVACRLVLEGGFDPKTITPRPPFRVEVEKASGKRFVLHHDDGEAGSGERTVFGGIKTKDVDVVVAIDGIGPCVAISLKGMLNAHRNLTNRLEEAVGDCTNIHIAYPALVYGFLHLLRANHEGPVPENGQKFLQKDSDGNVKKPDIAVTASGEIASGIRRYHDAIARLVGRRDLRNDITRYEALGLVLVSPEESTIGTPVFYPPATSVLHFDRFFPALYEQYDLRFVYGAPALAGKTRRIEWDADSPVLNDPRLDGIRARVTEGPTPPEP